MTEIDRLLSRANPVPTPPPGRVTPAQERLLASIVADPPRRRRVPVVRLIAVPAAIAVAVALVLVTGRSAGVNDELEATGPGLPASGNGELIHVSTRLYGTLYGPGLGERLDGWFEPATGRARIVITTGGEMTLQQVVDAEGRTRSWQGALGNAGGITGEHTAPGAAASVRRLVRNRMSSLVAQAKRGFRRDNAIVGAATTQPGEYRGRPVTVHRIAPSLSGGRPSGYYFKWYTEADTGAIIAFERGVVAGDDVVEEGEELTKLESVPAARAHGASWHGRSRRRPKGPRPWPRRPPRHDRRGLVPHRRRRQRAHARRRRREQGARARRPPRRPCLPSADIPKPFRSPRSPIARSGRGGLTYVA
jgi:hypothetical protein